MKIQKIAIVFMLLLIAVSVSAVTIDDIEDGDVVNSGTFFTYSVLVALGGVIGIVVLLVLATRALKALEIGEVLKRLFK